MDAATCDCGAVGQLLPDPGHELSRRMEWRGGRIGLDKVALEDARAGVTTCPACQHRSCVFMLVQHARAERRRRTGA
jgi:hypothetical protein